MRIHEMLQHTVQVGASDLHLSAEDAPAIRLHGEVQRLDSPALSPDKTKRMVYALMNDRQKHAFERDKEVDFSIGIRGLARFRVNAFETSRGVASVFRVIPDEILSLESLNLPRALKSICSLHRGLVLVTGPTGSGKSTTLAALVDHINRNRRCHILTIEDPIEFVHRPAECIINQRELGMNTHSFSAALRSALREDPDVILVGELRDLETMRLAITAAETGHLVFGTLHTKSAPDTVSRLIDAFPPSQQEQVRTQLATSLEAVIAQTLVPIRGGNGRIAACELMLVNYAIRNLIRENKIFQISSLMQTSGASGMQTLENNLKELAMAGKIERSVAADLSGNPKLFG